MSPYRQVRMKYDLEMAGVIAKHDVACCLMHNKANTEYNNFLTDMLTETQECVNIARKAGIKDERIILDPGVGFGKTYEINNNELISYFPSNIHTIEPSLTQAFDYWNMM